MIMAILFEENNVISLRTASVVDTEGSVYFALDPADLMSEMRKGGRWNFEWVSQDSTWLYRHRRSPAEETKLISTWPRVVDQNLKPMVFEKPPEFRLIWTDSGHGVALYLNGEPWAFIDEKTHEAYSKGVLNPMTGAKPWDQRLFELIFEGRTTCGGKDR